MLLCARQLWSTTEVIASVRFAVFPQAQQSIGCVSDVAQHCLVYAADVMVNTAEFGAFSAYEGHAAAVPLYRHGKGIMFLMCCKLSMRFLVAVWGEGSPPPLRKVLFWLDPGQNTSTLNKSYALVSRAHQSFEIGLAR